MPDHSHPSQSSRGLARSSARRSLPLATLLATLLWAWVGSPASAQAQGSVRTIGKGRANELGRRMTIELGSVSAELREQLTVANDGDEELQLVYDFRLPLHAAVTGASVSLSGGTSSTMGVVDARAALRRFEEPQAEHEADLGLLRMTALNSAEPGYREYELRIYPLPPKSSAEIELQMSLPVTREDGVDTLRLPLGDKDLASTRAALQVDVRAQGSLRELRGNGKLLARQARRGKSYRFFPPKHGELVVQSRAASPLRQPRAEVALLPIGPRSGVAAIRLTHPHKGARTPRRFKRVLLLVDGSSSLGPAGHGAARRVVESILTGIGSGTQIELIHFQRQAQGVLGGFRQNTRESRSAIDRALSGASHGSGSNLEAAIDKAAALLAEAGKMDDTLTVIVSDGLLSTELDVDRANRLLSSKDGEGSQLLAAVLVPDEAPLPDLRHGPLAALTSRRGGRAVALWHGEAEERGSELLSELELQAPLESIDVELDEGSWVGAHVGERLLPGNSELALGFYEGAVPRVVRVLASQGGRAIEIKATPLKGVEARRLAQMALADTTPDSLPEDEEDSSELQRRHRMTRVSAQLSVVSEVSSAVLISRKNAFGLERLRMAQRWGGSYFRRMASPAEIAGDAAAILTPFRHKHRSESPRQQRTGTVDPEMIARLIRAHVVPAARGCYDKLLRRDRGASGRIVLHLEVARGEVHHARLSQLPRSLAPIADCVVDAAYAMPAPTVLQGDEEEELTVALYPLDFRLKDKGARRPRGKVEQTQPPVQRDPSREFDPLTGLPE